MKNSYFFLAILGILSIASSCKKSTPAPLAPAVSSSVTEFSGNFNGANYDFKEGTNNVIGHHSVDNSSGRNGTGLTIMSSRLENSAGITLFKVSFGTMQSASFIPTDAEMNNFFSAGSRSYSAGAKSGVEIYFTDNAGIAWSTSNGSGSQAGSSFQVIGSSLITQAGSSEEKVNMSFSCTLYNSSGASMKLSNGSYLGYFIKD